MAQQQQRLQLYQQPLFKELRRVVPGYFDDSSEGWYIALPTHDKHWLTQNRQKFLENIESFDNAKVLKEKKHLEDELIEFVKEILPRCHKLKEKAKEIDKKKFEQITVESRKKQRIAEDTDDEDEYEPDDYLPNLTPKVKEKKPTIERPRRQQDGPTTGSNQEVPMMWTPSFAGSSSTPLFSPKTTPTRPPPPARPAPARPQVDELTYGITDDLTKGILNDLRELITKYDCRDRVLRAIKGLKSDRSYREALSNLDILIEKSTKK